MCSVEIDVRYVPQADVGRPHPWLSQSCWRPLIKLLVGVLKLVLMTVAIPAAHVAALAMSQVDIGPSLVEQRREVEPLSE
jgi:hypothetical protein